MQTLKPAKIAMYAKIQAKKGQMLSWQFVNIWDGSHTGLQYLTFQAGLPPVKKKKKKNLEPISVSTQLKTQLDHRKINK